MEIEERMDNEWMDKDSERGVCGYMLVSDEKNLLKEPRKIHYINMLFCVDIVATFISIVFVYMLELRLRGITEVTIKIEISKALAHGRDNLTTRIRGRPEVKEILTAKDSKDNLKTAALMFGTGLFIVGNVDWALPPLTARTDASASGIRSLSDVSSIMFF